MASGRVSENLLDKTDIGSTTDMTKLMMASGRQQDGEKHRFCQPLKRH